MKWDAVEREFFIVAVQLETLARAFKALAGELQRERVFSRVALNEEAVTQSSEAEQGGPGFPDTPALPF